MPPVILYDGVCGLCNRFVQFVIKRERRGEILFAALQSLKGQELLRSVGLPAQQLPDTIVLIEWDEKGRPRAFLKSEAALRACARLQVPWAFLALLRGVPVAIRDGVYDWVARQRYAIFGRLDQCPLPSPEQRKRFLG